MRAEEAACHVKTRVAHVRVLNVEMARLGIVPNLPQRSVGQWTMVDDPLHIDANGINVGDMR